MEWKNNAPYVLCLSHDVDRVKKQWYHYLFYGIKQPILQLKSLWKKINGIEPYWNFEKLMALENNYNVRSTFLFLNESHKELSANFMGRYNINSEKVKKIIKKLDLDGYDIGLHGSYFSYKDEDLLLKEKLNLECIVGHEIVSTRQHHLKFDKDETWRIHKKADLKYDSSIGYSDIVGEDSCFRTVEGIIEIPITLMDTVHLCENTYNKCCEVASKGGVVMLNFHQCHFNELEYPQNVAMYKRILEKAKQDGAWITNIKMLGDWLDERI